MTNQNKQNDKPNTTAPHQDQPRQGEQQDQQQRHGSLQTDKPAGQDRDSNLNRDREPSQYSRPGQ